MDEYEELENSIDPHRFEQRAAAVAEVAGRLRDRGVVVTGGEKAEDLVDLLEAVQQFEAVVEAHGGDLMVDDLKGSQPDDPHFVLPRRGFAEATRAYVGRIHAATTRLRHHPPRPD